MQIPVLLEPIAGNGYRARGLEPFGVCAEGATRDEALQNLRQALNGRLAGGAEILPLEIPSTHPLASYAGVLKDDPYFDEWQQTIAELRRQADEDPDY
jgi:predicted RNase H-like HicB family nuclease